jgi:hypothetical protein
VFGFGLDDGSGMIMNRPVPKNINRVVVFK